MKEIWKPIKGYENLYKISNLGRVISIKTNKIRKLGYDKDNYLKIELYNKSYKSVKVHRLVAEAFIPNPCHYSQVNHIDGNKSNNRVDNLEWCNGSYNCRHRVYQLNKNSLYPCKKVKCCELNKTFPSISMASHFIKRKQSKIGRASCRERV